MRQHATAIRETREDSIGHIISMFILAVVMVILFYPMWTIVIASFSDPKELYQTTFLVWPRNWTLGSYQMVFKDKDFLTGFYNAVRYTFFGTILNVVMNICGAYPLSRRSFKGKKFFTLMFTFTMFFNGGMIPTYILVNKLGLLNKIWAMILPSAVGMYNIIVMRTYFQTRIPMELEDAAMIDGCTNFKFLMKVVLPLSHPIIAVIALYYGVGRWNDYFTAMMYLTKRELYPLQLVLREILLQNEASNMLNIATDAGYADRMISRMGLKYAVIVISTIPILLIYPFVQKFFAKGVMVGAIKG